MFKPRAQQMLKFLADKKFEANDICDVGAGYGILLEELKKLAPEKNIFAIEPGDELSKVCRDKGIETLQATCEGASEWHGRFDLVVCSEVIEHVFSPLEFADSLRKLVKKDGYCLVTGLGYEGFDILTLKEKSNSIFPPHHINFMSVNGFEKLFKRAGFSSVEVITPGKLDVDIVLNSGEENEFVKALASRGEEFLQKFQDLLVEAKLSSHVWVFCKH